MVIVKEKIIGFLQAESERRNDFLQAESKRRRDFLLSMSKPDFWILKPIEYKPKEFFWTNS